MAIEIKPEKEKRLILPSSFNVLFYYSIILLFFSVSSYLLISQWSSRLEAEVTKKAEVFERLENQKDFKRNQNLVLDQRLKIDNYIFLYNDRVDFDNLFLFLEKMIHPLSSIENVNLKIKDKELMVEGSTLNYDTLEQQYAILKDFKIEREVSGWLPMKSIEEGEKGELKLKNKSGVDLYKNPLKRENRITLNEINDIEFLQKIEADEYSFGRKNQKIIKNDWYEVVVYERINPVEKVTLTDIAIIEGEFKIGFNFDIELNPLIFNQ
jgi:hypothetical protein